MKPDQVKPIDETAPKSVPGGNGLEPDIVRLRFKGEGKDGEGLTELSAAALAEVLEGLVSLASDFGKAGAFSEGIHPELMVRPPREGSFEIDVVNAIQQYSAAAAMVGGPSLASVIWWATKSYRVEMRDYDYLDNGRVKITWQDDTVDEVTVEVLEELLKRRQKRKKDLRKIMAPLGHAGVTSLEMRYGRNDEELDAAPAVATLGTDDYNAVLPLDEVEEGYRVFTTEAQMLTVDFAGGESWRVKTPQAARKATVEDSEFLLKVDRGLALHKTDIFNLQIREDWTTRNGRTSTTWTVLKVLGHRRGAGDHDGTNSAGAQG